MKDPVQQRVKSAVEAALDKKAFDLEVLDVRKLTSIGDFFILCSGNTERQTLAIADAVQDKIAQVDRTKPRMVEGVRPGRWILLDYGDFVMHIFTDECRRFYALERLWGDAPDVTAKFTGAAPMDEEETAADRREDDRRGARRSSTETQERRTTTERRSTKARPRTGTGAPPAKRSSGSRASSGKTSTSKSGDRSSTTKRRTR